MIEAIDAIVGPYVTPGAPGLAIGVVHDGTLRDARGYGLANLEWGAPIGSDTVFRLGSLTKQFTAMAIMLLCEENRLALDDALTTHLPAYPIGGQTITVEQLLTHTAGITDYTGLPEFTEHKHHPDMAPAEIAAVFQQYPLEFVPGSRFRYSNSGYVLLGMIVEAISGVSYAEFVRSRIFAPLGMHQSCYLSNEPIVRHRASGYVTTEQGYQNAPFANMTLPYAAGALGSSVQDLARWDMALRENRLVRPSTLERMHTPVRLLGGGTANYGFGWMIGAYEGRRVMYHGGGINGFVTSMYHWLDDHVTVIALANLFDYGLNVDAIARRVSRHALGLPPLTRRPISLPAEARRQVVGTYAGSGITFEALWSGETLILRGLGDAHLLPLSRQRFYRVEDSEAEVVFSTVRDGLYATFTFVNPLEPFEPFVATRV
jgi:CubicO group peptidase (beta-lactamase class C family)